MINKSDLQDHPLFKNRRRVLAIPAKAESEITKASRLGLANMALAIIIFTVFLLGFALSNPAIINTLGALPGQRWNELMQHQFGSAVGTGLAEKSPWITSRVAGIISYLLVFASVCLGLMVSMRLTDRFFHRASLVYLHKILSLMLLVFVSLHLLGLMLDSYMKITLIQDLVPFSTAYRPLWTGIGTICLYGVIAIVTSFYLAGKLGYKVWRALHYLSFLVFAGSFAHGFMAGTDSKSVWMQAVYMATGFIVTLLIGARIFNRSEKDARSIALD